MGIRIAKASCTATSGTINGNVTRITFCRLQNIHTGEIIEASAINMNGANWDATFEADAAVKGHTYRVYAHGDDNSAAWSSHFLCT
jgi:hypothetical protein